MLNQKQMLMHCMVLMDIVDCMDMDTVLATVLTLLGMALDTLASIMDMVMDIPGMDTMARDLLRLSQRLMLMHSMVLMVMVCMDLDTELILLDMDLGMDILVFIMDMVTLMDMDTMDKLTAGSNKSKNPKDTTLNSRISSPTKLISSYTSFFFHLYMKQNE